MKWSDLQRMKKVEAFLVSEVKERKGENEGEELQVKETEVAEKESSTEQKKKKSPSFKH